MAALPSYETTLNLPIYNTILVLQDFKTTVDLPAYSTYLALPRS